MIHLTILHTNDMHGCVDQLPRITTLSRQIRTQVEPASGLCMLWDAGDAEDTTLLESRITKGESVMKMLRGAGYTLVALGNAIPLRYGPQAIPGLARGLGRPLLCANLLDSLGRPLPGLSPYTIENAGPLAIGVIGLTAPMPFYLPFKVVPADPLTLLPKLIAEVRAQGTRTVVLLSHLGSARDREIAEQTPGIDVIIGGHDHVELAPPLVVNGTIIAQAGDKGRFLGRLDLEIDPDSGRVARHRGELIRIGPDIPPNPEVQAVIETEQERVRQTMLRVVGELRDPLDWAADRQCAAGNLLADMLLDRVKGAEISLVLGGHWMAGLPAGPVTLGRLHTALHSTANPGRVILSGEQITQFLQEGLRPGNAVRQLRPLRGAAAGMPHVAGMQARYDPMAHRLLDVQVGDEPLQAERRYAVAATDREFYDYIGYLVIPQDQIEFELPTILPEVFMDYLAKYSPLPAPAADRIRS